MGEIGLNAKTLNRKNTQLSYQYYLDLQAALDGHNFRVQGLHRAYGYYLDIGNAETNCLQHQSSLWVHKQVTSEDWIGLG